MDSQNLNKNLGAEEDFEISNKGGLNQDDDKFDRIVGEIQEIVLDPTFEKEQKDFLAKHSSVFEDTEENKHEYTKIFQDYQSKLEAFIEKRLRKSMPELDMKEFFSNFESRIDQVDPNLLDMLLSFSDFQQFKELMLASKNKGTDIGGLKIQGQAKALHHDDKENVQEKAHLHIHPRFGFVDHKEPTFELVGQQPKWEFVDKENNGHKMKLAIGKGNDPEFQKVTQMHKREFNANPRENIIQ